MADLSSVISIACILDNSGATPVIRVVDNSAYGIGIPQQIAGVLEITQPDTVKIANTDFTNPDVFFSGGSLTQPAKPLRLANDSRFQNGGYLIKYTVRCPGFSDTVLLKSFTLNYTAPVPVITQAFDNFTPSLKVNDSTSWGVAGLTFINVVETWSGLIRSVVGVNQPIQGAGITFDLAFGGNYYDSAYDINLTAVVTWQIPGASPFVTIVDKFTPPQETFTAEIPPTLPQLLTALTVLKSQLDSAQNNGNTFGNSIFGNLLTTYSYAVSLYTHLIDRGQVGSLAGLSDYVYQLQMIFNNGVTPSYVNTNAIIPPYNWGGSSGSSAWAGITGKPVTIKVQWTVGQNGFPLAGAISYSSAALAGISLSQILMFRGNVYYPSFTKASDAANTITWPDALANQEPVLIILLPL